MAQPGRPVRRRLSGFFVRRHGPSARRCPRPAPIRPAHARAGTGPPASGAYPGPAGSSAAQATGPRRSSQRMRAEDRSRAASSRTRNMASPWRSPASVNRREAVKSSVFGLPAISPSTKASRGSAILLPVRRAHLRPFPPGHGSPAPAALWQAGAIGPTRHCRAASRVWTHSTLRRSCDIVCELGFARQAAGIIERQRQRGGAARRTRAVEAKTSLSAAPDPDVPPRLPYGRHEVRCAVRTARQCIGPKAVNGKETGSGWDMTERLVCSFYVPYRSDLQFERTISHPCAEAEERQSHDPGPNRAGSYIDRDKSNSPARRHFNMKHGGRASSDGRLQEQFRKALAEPLDPEMSRRMAASQLDGQSSTAVAEEPAARQGMRTVRSGSSRIPRAGTRSVWPRDGLIRAARATRSLRASMAR